MASAQPQDLRKGKGRRYGSKNWTITESMDFLAVVHRLKPASPRAWELVTQEYERCRKAEYPKRTADQLQRRWKTLIKHPKAVGDRNCSDDVRRYAKRIKRVIEQSWDGVELGMRHGRDESSGGEYYSDESDDGYRDDDGYDDDDEVLDDEVIANLMDSIAVVADTVRRMDDRAARRVEEREDERRFRREELQLEREHLAARREEANIRREDARREEANIRREEANRREDARREEANRREDARREEARQREDARQRRFIILQQQFVAAQAAQQAAHAAQQQQQVAQQQQFFALMLAMLQRRGHGLRPTDVVAPQPGSCRTAPLRATFTDVVVSQPGSTSTDIVAPQPFAPEKC